MSSQQAKQKKKSLKPKYYKQGGKTITLHLASFLAIERQSKRVPTHGAQVRFAHLIRFDDTVKTRYLLTELISRHAPQNDNNALIHSRRQTKSCMCRYVHVCLAKQTRVGSTRAFKNKQPAGAGFYTLVVNWKKKEFCCSVITLLDSVAGIPTGKNVWASVRAHKGR